MDYRRIVNWLISPLPPLFSKDESGNPIGETPSIATGLNRLWVFVKIVFFGVIVFAIVKLVIYLKK
jgi:HAMP domain-containing protein